MLLLAAILICFLSLMDSPSIVEHSYRLDCGIAEVNKKKKKNHLMHGIFCILRPTPLMSERFL